MTLGKGVGLEFGWGKELYVEVVLGAAQKSSKCKIRGRYPQ